MQRGKQVGRHDQCTADQHRAAVRGHLARQRSHRGVNTGQ
jgi:hypothetical protein